LYNWADRPAGLSKGYRDGEIPPSSKFEDGPDMIQDVMRQLDSTFVHKCTSYNNEYLSNGFRTWFLKSLEDPGRLYYVVFWNVASDVEAVSFEWHLFKGHTDICSDIIHGASYNLFGAPLEITPEVEEGWHRLISMHGAIAGENQIIKHEPPEFFECIDFGIATSASVQSSFYLFTTVMNWPLLVRKEDIFDSISKALEHANEVIAERNRKESRPNVFYVIDHAVANNVATWGITHVRVFIKKIVSIR
jgi:hypothetical protein